MMGRSFDPTVKPRYEETIAGMLAAQGFASVLVGMGISYYLIVDEGEDEGRGITTKLYTFVLHGDKQKMKQKMQYYFSSADR